MAENVIDLSGSYKVFQNAREVVTILTKVFISSHCKHLSSVISAREGSEMIILQLNLYEIIAKKWDLKIWTLTHFFSR